uniref:28 kDa heat- and acid-stable phosphoprotein-like n=1 Tax=Sinocyclocheilus anshuiensis TaxID=1608454 RepID=A0A671RW47_9TELE
MPKGGKKGGHKGRMRTYTSPEEIDAQMKAEKERKKNEEEEGAAVNDNQSEDKLTASGSEDSDDEGSHKKKGVEGLIEIENPNRAAQKSKKVTDIELEGPRQLSRREREEIEKQKTDQAKADLARLAIIRKQREDAARKKEEERKAKEAVQVAAAATKGLHTLSLK